MMRRARLELRRFVGWLAWLVICKTPIGTYRPFILGGHVLSRAGLFAHWDSDRSNWAHEPSPLTKDHQS